MASNRTLNAHGDWKVYHSIFVDLFFSSSTHIHSDYTSINICTIHHSTHTTIIFQLIVIINNNRIQYLNIHGHLCVNYIHNSNLLWSVYSSLGCWHYHHTGDHTRVARAGATSSPEIHTCIKTVLTVNPSASKRQGRILRLWWCGKIKWHQTSRKDVDENNWKGHVRLR